MRTSSGFVIEAASSSLLISILPALTSESSLSGINVDHGGAVVGGGTYYLSLNPTGSFNNSSCLTNMLMSGIRRIFLCLD